MRTDFCRLSIDPHAHTQVYKIQTCNKKCFLKALFLRVALGLQKDGSERMEIRLVFLPSIHTGCASGLSAVVRLQQVTNLYDYTVTEIWVSLGSSFV